MIYLLPLDGGQFYESQIQLQQQPLTNGTMSSQINGMRLVVNKHRTATQVGTLRTVTSCLL